MKFYFKPILLTGEGGGTGHSSGGGGDNGFEDPFAVNPIGSRSVLKEALTENTDFGLFGFEPEPDVVPEVTPEIPPIELMPTENIDLEPIG